jgi:hypothetical protein
MKQLKILALVLGIMLTSVFNVAPADTNQSREDMMKDVHNFLEWKRYDAELDRFIDHLGKGESNNNWLAVNQIGAFGEYQFMNGTMRFLGYSHITSDKFQTNPNIFPPELQKKVLIELMRSNELVMQKYIKRFEGKVLYGIRITKSGILAACHLAGAGGVQNFFNNNYIAEDMNGTTVLTYLEKYQNYNLNLNLV